MLLGKVSSWAGEGEETKKTEKERKKGRKEKEEEPKPPLLQSSRIKDLIPHTTRGMDLAYSVISFLGAMEMALVEFFVTLMEEISCIG